MVGMIHEGAGVAFSIKLIGIWNLNAKAIQTCMARKRHTHLELGKT
jgi:hypothetical protein